MQLGCDFWRFLAWEGHFLAFLCDNWVQNNEGHRICDPHYYI